MILIDGTNLHLRLLNGLKHKDNYHMKFLNNILHLSKRFNDNLIMVAWDISPSQFRTSLYADYKKGLGSAVPDIVFQKRHKTLIELHSKVLPICGIPSVCLSGVEADDIIYGMCQKYGAEEKVIISEDQDYLQLVNSTTKVYQPIKKQLIDDDFLCAQFGVSDIELATKLVLIQKCLKGDPSDNIKRIPSIGDVTLARIIKGYTVGTFLEGDRNLLKQHKESIEVHRKLVSLKEIPEVWAQQINQRIDVAVNSAHQYSNNVELVSEVVSEFGLFEVADEFFLYRDALAEFLGGGV